MKKLFSWQVKKENTREEKFKRYVKKCHGLCIKLNPLHYAGIPDRMVLLPGGRIFFVELKRDGYKVKPGGIQDHWHKTLRKLGFQVFVITNDEEFDNFFMFLL